MLYDNMCQAYRFFMSNDDDSKDCIVEDIKSELRLFETLESRVEKENEDLEAQFAQLELQRQDLDDEVRALESVGKELPEVLLTLVNENSCRNENALCVAMSRNFITSSRETRGRTRANSTRRSS